MPLNIKFGTIFLMTLHFASVILGQALSFRHLTTDDGLSQNSINCIYQDRTGFMWFGTQDGLNRYDGYNIITFRHDPSDSSTISHSWIWDVHEDKDRNLWIATWRGLNRYDRYTGKFTVFHPDSTDSGAILGDRPAAICEDTLGNIWIGTWGGGLNKYLKEEDRFVHYLHRNGETYSLPNNFIRTMFVDSSGRIWIGTWGGLAVIISNKDSVYFKNYLMGNATEGIAPARVMSISGDKGGNIWVGTFGSGLFKINPNDIIENLRHDPNDPNSLSSNDISSLLVDQYGIVWAGTITDGLNRIDPGSGRIERISSNSHDISGIASNEVYSLYEDRSGLLWIGAGGINILNQRHKRFNEIEIDHPDIKDIIAFCEDDDGNLWLASNQNGVIKYNPSVGETIVFKNELNDPGSLSFNGVSDIAKDKDGNIWIATRGGGLNLYEPRTGSFRHFPAKDVSPDITSSMKYINGIAVDNLGIIWIGTYDGGLIMFDPKNNRYQHYYARAGDPASLSGNYVLHVFIDGRNNLWAEIWGGGICRFNREDNSFTRFLYDPEDPHSLPDNIVHSMHEVLSDSGRVLWVGTSNGLSYFFPDEPESQFHHFTTKDGLHSNVIYGILHDDQGNLWLSGNGGITKFNPVSGKVTHYNSGDGLQANEYNASAFYKLKNGLFLFGGVNGFNAFYPDKIRESNYRPNIAFTSIRVMNEERFSPLQLPVINELVLPFRDNFFSFEFVSLDFTQPAKNKYQYRLEGIDQNWVDAGARRFANYTDIRAGDYVFKVRGTNSDGIWSNHIRAFQVTVLPPYWQTWWFYAVILIVIMAVLYTIHRYRVKRILEMERLRIRIASDLHDDIGSALTRIAIHSEQLQTGKNPDEVHGISQRIGALSRSVISTMSDIVWSIDARNDTWGNMLDRMKDVVHNTLMLKDIRTDFKVERINEAHRITLKYRQNIFYIFKEAVNNILKHSNATKVKITVRKDANTFFMEISDNGEGFDHEKIRYGNGLKNMKMRAANIGGTLEINSEKGVTVRLKVKGIAPRHSQNHVLLHHPGNQC